MYENPNLRFRDGYGYTNACVVDMDSALRNDSQITHDRTKIQLCARWNHAVPDLGKGGLIPNIESRLKNAEDKYGANIKRINQLLIYQQTIFKIILSPPHHLFQKALICCIFTISDNDFHGVLCIAQNIR
jgi:hypothetical protein